MRKVGIPYYYKLDYFNGKYIAYKKKEKGNWYKIKPETFIKETGAKIIYD